MNPATPPAERRIFYRSVLALVLPMAAQNLINVGISSLDVIMLGRVSETVLSASSLANQIQFIMTMIFFGVTSGACVLTAQYWGKGETRVIEKVLGIALRISIVTGILFASAALLLPRQLMQLFTTELPVIEEGVSYLRTVAVSYLFISITAIYLNIMRSVERVIISTVVYLVSLVINGVLNAVFIFGLWGFPAMGITGAALATSIARLAELTIVLVYAYRPGQPVRLRFSDIFVQDSLLLRDFLRYSIPVTLNEMMWGGGVSAITAVIGHMGSAAVAANSVAQVTRQLATVVTFGVSNATAIMIGKAIGEGNEGRAEDYGRRFVWLTIIMGVCSAGVVLLVSPIAQATMTLTPQAQNYLSFMMFVMSYFVVGQAFNTTMVVGVFRAGGDTRFGLIEDVTTMWGISILLGAVGAFFFHWPVELVYVVLMSDEIIKIPINIWRYRSKIWLRNVTRPAA